MEKRNFWKGAGVGLLLSILVIVVTSGFVNRYDYIDKKLQVIENALGEHYIGDLDREKLEQGIYKGFVSAVGDPYTSYFSPKEFKSFMEKSSGVYAGIGVQMTIDSDENAIVTVEVFKGSPAEKAGMLPQDRIIKAAGKRLTDKDFDLAPTLIKGEPGTKVMVTVFRPSENKTYDLEITRENVVYPTVDYKMLQNDIGYISVKEFEELTYKQFKASLTELESKHAKGLIIDLRNNPGGLLHITVKMVDELIPKGVIVSTKDNKGKIITENADDKYTDIPIVVLVNSQSASAAEVLAGALKDHQRAKLVGTTTFGKGIVQSIMPLTDGSALKVTTAQYFTPSGVCIQGKGIEPDVKAELAPELMIKGKLSEEEDTQLQKAKEVLLQQIK
ncbi:MAG: S41 family peptidase [Cellulosilyticaceae bacterium]